MQYRNHIQNWEDLITTPEAKRTGFLTIVLAKNVKGTPFVEEAKNLKILAAVASTARDLLNLRDIYPALISAAGISDKAIPFLNEDDKQAAIINLIDTYLEPAGSAFIDELVYRFLLTKGDALGGIMRNLVGHYAEYKLVRSIISTFSLTGISFKYLDKRTKRWIDGNNSETTLEENARGLYWNWNGKQRILLFNIKPNFIGNGVDAVLLNASYNELKWSKRSSLIELPDRYLALGELKGGIDPAGADEHWKTANTAIARLRTVFNPYGNDPKTFFIGAAIEAKMAQELYNQLESGLLTNVANLNIDTQLVSLCNWLCTTL